MQQTGLCRQISHLQIRNSQLNHKKFTTYSGSFVPISLSFHFYTWLDITMLSKYKTTRNTLILFSLFLSYVANAAPLAGDYFINQNGSENYNSIALAVADLNSNGVSAPVTFNMRSGTYDERAVINSITRSGSVDDRVVFKRATPADTVIIKNSNQDSTFNYIFKLSNAKYISFVNLEFEATNADYQHVLEYSDDTDSITVATCIFRGLNYTNIISNRGELVYSFTSNPSLDATSTGLVFTGNTFENGYSGISIVGSNKPTNTVSDNTFTNQAIKSILVIGTTATSNINNNTIDSSFVRSLDYTAMSVSGLGSVFNNEIKLNSLSTAEVGMELSGDVISTPLLVYNNTVSSSNPVGGSVGVDLSNKVKFLHNSIKMEHLDDIPLNVSATEADSLWIKNNLLINTGSGKTFVASTDANRDAVTELFDNDYYTAGGIVSFWGDLTSFTSVNAFQVGTQPKHPKIGLSRNVTFVNASSGNLRLFGASIGDKYLVAHPQSEVTTDLDNETRATINTYIGADIPSLAGSSIAPMDNADAATGVFYSIGGSSPDYATAQEAFDDLYRRGMKGEVKFRLRPGTYPVNANFYKIVKQNPADLITITSSSPTNGVLSFSGDSNPNNILRFDKTSYVTIEGVDFDMGLSTANGIEFYNSQNTTINNGAFTAGNKAIEISTATNSDNHSISNNSFTDQKINAIRTDSATSIDIDANTIDSSEANFIGIYLANTTSDTLIVQNNKFRGTGTTIGIYLDNANGEVNNRGLIANNFISTNKGIFAVNSSANWNIIHNSMNTNTTAVVLKALTGLKPSNFDFTNNIVQTPSGVINLRINEFESQADDTIVLDYNIYYNQVGGGAFLNWYGLSFFTLNSFTSNTGMDFNSHKKMVTFANTTIGNLHLAGSSIGDNDLAGTNTIITTDIDGDTRASVFPYMGADETTALNPARIEITADNNQTSEDSSQLVNLSYVLLSQPSDNVTVSVASSDNNEGTINTTDMTFTPSNWNTAQVKTVSGVDDNIMEGDINYSITTTVSSADSNYNNLAVQDITLVNIDDDLDASLRLSIINSMQEPNTAGTFRISLVKSLPPPNDTLLVNAEDITVSFLTQGSGTVGVDFTDASGSVLIPALSSGANVGISPIDDNFIEGLEQASIVLSGKSGGVGFISVGVNTLIDMDIVDNEDGTIIVSQSQNMAEPNTDGGFTLSTTSGVATSDTEIYYYFAGVASNGSDYNQPANYGIATLAAMSSSLSIPLSVIDDIDSEGSEIATIRLTGSNNILLPVSSDTPPFVEITDNDTSADIAVTISAINNAYAIGDVVDFVITVGNNSPINIHQAVLQVLEPAGLSFYDWECYGNSNQCTTGSQSGDINDTISIDANSSIQYQVFALATGQIEDSLTIQAIVNPAPFLTDTDTSNNTDNASSLIDVYFANGFEAVIARNLLKNLADYSINHTDFQYAYVTTEKNIATFIEIDKKSTPLRYRYLFIDSIIANIDSSDWIYAK